MFRQLAATVPSTDWGQLNSALYTVTFMAQQNGKERHVITVWRLTTRVVTVHWLPENQEIRWWDKEASVS